MNTETAYKLIASVITRAPVTMGEVYALQAAMEHLKKLAEAEAKQNERTPIPSA